MEMPNSENIEVASSYFWLDPSHLRPIPVPQTTTIGLIRKDK